MPHSAPPQEEALLTLYRQYLRLEENLSPNSIAAYLHDARRVTEFARMMGKTLAQLQQDDLNQLTAQLVDSDISMRSVSRFISSIRTFYRFCVAEGRVKENVAADLILPKLPKHLPAVLSLAEVDAVLHAVEPGTRDSLRNTAIIELLYSCGLRVSELCALKLNDLFLQEGFVRISGKGNKERLVPMSPKAVTDIQNYLADPLRTEPKPEARAYLFISGKGNKISRNMVFNIVQALALRSGIGKEISPHTFRHSFATHLLEGGADLHAIQLMLGHEDVSTTEIYTHVEDDQVREALYKNPLAKY